METIEVIKNRRSTRFYSDQPISQDNLEKILEAGLWAPSGINQQPWYFVAISSADQMSRLTGIMKDVSKKVEPGLKERFPAHPDVVRETTCFMRWLGGAPACILAFRYRDDYENKADVVTLSLGAAIENMILRAVDLGIGSCWMTAPVEAGYQKQLRDMFAPGKGELVSMVTLGYPSREPIAPKRKPGRYTII